MHPVLMIHTILTIAVNDHRTISSSLAAVLESLGPGLLSALAPSALRHALSHASSDRYYTNRSTTHSLPISTTTSPTTILPLRFGSQDTV